MTNDILVPIDGSRLSLRALDHAIALAGKTGGTIHLLTVEAPLDPYGMVPSYIPSKRHRELTRERALKTLQPAVRRAQAARARHEVLVEWGETAETIATVARRLKCGGIVMGTRGMGAVGTLFLGSVATKVVHLAKAPVTLVK